MTWMNLCETVIHCRCVGGESSSCSSYPLTVDANHICRSKALTKATATGLSPTTYVDRACAASSPRFGLKGPCIVRCNSSVRCGVVEASPKTTEQTGRIAGTA